jgi:limonene-1,2-epoxide hydrolase
MKAEDVVRSMFEAWSRLEVDEIVSHFDPDAVWHNMPYEPVHGLDGIRRVSESYAKRTSACYMEVLNLAVTGNVVLTERVDHLELDGRKVDAPAMGALEVAGDRIMAWRDYFDASKATP